MMLPVDLTAAWIIHGAFEQGVYISFDLVWLFTLNF